MFTITGPSVLAGLLFLALPALFNIIAKLHLETTGRSAHKK